MPSSSNGSKDHTSEQAQTPLVEKAVVTAVRTYITDELLHRSDLNIADDTPLIQKGYLTSLQTVELVMFLEERFGIQVDPEEVNEQDFRSLASIASLVERKMEAA